MSQNLYVDKLPYLYAYGFMPTLGGGSAYSLTFTKGHVRDINNNTDIVSTKSLIVDLATKGALGLDTGTVAANTVYAFFVIADSSGKNPTSIIGTLASNSVPITPQGYDSIRLICYWATGSAGLRNGCQVGNGNMRIFTYFDFGSYPSLNAGTTVNSYVTVPLTPMVPNIENNLISLFVIATVQNVNDTVSIQKNSSVQAVTITPPIANWNVPNFNVEVDSLTAGIPQITYKMTTAVGSLTFYVQTFTYFI